MYKVEKITEVNIQKALKFVLPYEYACVNLVSELIRFQKFLKRGATGNKFEKIFLKGFLLLDLNENIFGVLIINAYGTVLHCFPKGLHNDFFRNVEIQEFKGVVQSVLGTGDMSFAFDAFLDNSFFIKPYRIQNYDLLSFTGENAKLIENTSPCDLDIKFSPCTVYDIEGLLPLQMDYEKTEVRSGYGHVEKRITRLYLKKLLETQQLYKAEYHNKIISKVNTNARGFYCNQIGGMYTMPEFRNLGVAHALVKYMLLRPENKKKTFSLYVKKYNIAAKRLYEKTGFKYITDFRISYFR
ncbi:MAG: hypothetical protein CR988_04345 [Treponema sp.]|nr:MAG: hypothetical protein CR988_04345 [Treponema sp.]